jgi:hypothetical protein
MPAEVSLDVTGGGCRYPFQGERFKRGQSHAEAIEAIDVGGGKMLASGSGGTISADRRH